ncbi:hypothetical protein SAMN06297144_2693 [Sphingomonas guangdongensis]|uniref:YtxH-like protein n=1 Tax=Sphingomonas guangdongensis TaxID=1141890 RepID=A0A285R0D9_9SPHN|nr:hypothetical protein [Sphingomonas guangdongensis]SOB87561.1 hypothetical protein SAMN06297144_2693 [Sphingomonas guangdongensis]
MPDKSDQSKTPKQGKRDKLKERGGAALESARSTVQGLEANPLGVLVGGLAVGLIAGAVIPRSEREKRVLKPVGKRLAEGAVAALTAAKETGKEQLSAGVLSRDAAKESARKVFSSALDAAKTAKGAAADAPSAA